MADVLDGPAFSGRLGTDRTDTESVMERAQPVTEVAVFGSVRPGAFRTPQGVMCRVVVERDRVLVVPIGDVPPVRTAQDHHRREGHGNGSQKPPGSAKRAKH